MIVVDASAVADLLLELEPGGAWVEGRVRAERSLHAPHLLDFEVASAIRSRVAREDIPVGRGRLALTDLAALPVTRYPASPFLERVWALRTSITAYDAFYVALAEALNAPLITTDRRLARSTGHRAAIEAPAG